MRVPTSPVDKKAVLDAIRETAMAVGHSPSRREFERFSGLREYHVLQNFPSWREAVRATGLEPDFTNVKLEDRTLLEDWGTMVRNLRQIPTRAHYRREGRYNPKSFERHFGPWSTIPREFRNFAKGKCKWRDVLALLPPEERTPVVEPKPSRTEEKTGQAKTSHSILPIRHAKLEGRHVYGNPINFRGLQHEPVNEEGVVFLFGMVAKELGYLVEAVQAGFPDCEAKRQVSAGRWKLVRIEFEFESRDFRDRGRSIEGCDIIVCWRHNWPDCPSSLEVVELSTVIRSLAKSED
jgi:hypothetical protein